MKRIKLFYMSDRRILWNLFRITGATASPHYKSVDFISIKIYDLIKSLFIPDFYEGSN
jgi:hypothetical protein